jgi:uncharacterized protein (TIGR03118 family)
MRQYNSLRAALLLLAAPIVWGATPTGNAYLVHNLTADQPGIADFTDPNLINPWGVYTSATSPFWVNDTGTGLATVYTSNGTPNATTKPAIPGASSANGSPTGGVANATGGFLVQGKVPNFLFVTADGTISGWASAVDATKAFIQVNNSTAGAVYYGMAISATTTNANPQIFAANFHSGAIEVYDTNFKPVTLAAGAFVDSSVPAGYGPFNIWNLGGKLYVTWAQQNAAKTAWVDGAGLGAVSIFDLSGNLLQHVATGGPLNAPWGVAIAPATFGAFAGDLLIGNFGDGAINAFDPASGKSLGALADQNGNNISIPGLWALIVGNGGNGGDPNAIYFSAGGANQKHGLLGSIQAAPVVSANAVINAAGPAGGIASNTLISIYGASLAPVTRSLATTDISGTTLPSTLSGVSVTVNSKPAFIFYLSPKQIDVLTPVDTTTGPVNVVVTNNGLVSATAQATMNAFSPAFFPLKDGKSVAAIHANGALVGDTTLYTGLSTPAARGETISIFGTGFGTTTPGVTNGAVVTTPATVATLPNVTIGGVTATVTYGGLVSSGVYQFNVTVPTGLTPGDLPIIATQGTFTSPSTAILAVQ